MADGLCGMEVKVNQFLAKLNVLLLQRQTGCLQLQRRDGEEINIFVEFGMVVHAQYKWEFGIGALVEALGWQSYNLIFDATRQTPLHTLNLKESDLEQHLETSRQSIHHQLPSKKKGYFYNRDSTPDGLSEHEFKVFTYSNGLCIEDLVQRTGFSQTDVEQILRRLLERQVIEVDFNPATPERLKQIKPVQKVQKRGVLGFLSRTKTPDVTDLELQVFNMANGALTLWEMHLHFKISREQMWETYNALVRLDLLESSLS